MRRISYTVMTRFTGTQLCGNPTIRTDFNGNRINSSLFVLSLPEIRLSASGQQFGEPKSSLYSIQISIIRTQKLKNYIIYETKFLKVCVQLRETIPLPECR